MSISGMLSKFLVGGCLGLVASLGLAQEQQPRNIILIIGDGMDDQQITIARNYLKGSQGRLLLDEMPMRASVQVQTVNDTTPLKPVYVADSANSASSIATGVVTSRGRIATSASTDQDLRTIVELAQAQGYKTGIVTTANVTDATPAAFIAHISSRGCENPQMMVDALVLGRIKVDCSADLKANGGHGSIAEQIADSNLDVVLGGGSKHFAMFTPASEKTVLQSALDNQFISVQTGQQLQQAGSSQLDKKLLGLFSKSTMPVRLRAEGGRPPEKPEPSFLNFFHRYLGNVELPPAVACEANPEYLATPSLKAMTEVAIQRLNHNNQAGFFLMIESASIDKQSHQRQPCGSIGELQQLEESLASALAFAEKHSNTLVIVTADHGQAAQIIPDESLFKPFDVPVFTPGHLVRLKTQEGSILAINYATNDFPMEEHTGVNVPLFSNALGRSLLPTHLSQVELFEHMAKFLGLSDSPAKQH